MMVGTITNDPCPCVMWPIRGLSRWPRPARKDVVLVTSGFKLYPQGVDLRFDLYDVTAARALVDGMAAFSAHTLV